jgi:protein transport protein SEC24
MEYDEQQAAAAAAAQEKKKKRAYAQQAYEFGGNAAGAAQGQAQPPPQPAYGGAAPVYGQQPAYGAAPMPAYGQPLAQPMGAPQIPGAQDQLASQFGQMNMQNQPQAPQPLATAPPTQPNLLVASDIISQPFQVEELDLPPPQINLPPNSSVTPSPYSNCPPKYVRSTINAVPTTHSLLKKSKLPFALVISPYTSLHDNEDPVGLSFMVEIQTAC